MTENIVNAELYYRNRIFLAKNLAYRASETSYNRMLLGGDNSAGLLCRLYYYILVKRLYRVHIYYSRVYAFVLKKLISLKRFVHHKTGSDYCNIASVFKLYALSDLELIIVTENNRNGKSSETHINRTVKLKRCFYRLFSLGRVRRIYYSHTRDSSHKGDILAALVCSTVLAYRDTGVSRADYHVKMRVAYRVPYLFKGSARGEHGKGAAYYLFACGGYSCRYSHHIGFRYTAVIKPFRKSLFEHSGLCSRRKVGIKHQKIVSFFSQFYQSVSEAYSGCNLFNL